MSAILLKQLFSTDIAKNLFASNSFLMDAKNDDAFVDNDKVNLPHAGATPSVVKNRNSFPATAAQRTDTATQYDLDEFSTDPIHIQHSEELVVNYAKRANVVEEMVLGLHEQIALEALFAWGRGGDSENSWGTKPELIRTTSSATRPAAVNQIGGTGVTGTRKRIAKEDILKAGTILSRQNVPAGNRCALITADMLEDLMLIDEFANSDYNNRRPLADGSYPESFTFMGFKFYVRSYGNVFNNAATPVQKLVGAATAATDNNAALFWHRDFVRRAKGGVKTFVDTDVPEMYGDVISSLARAGFVGARSSSKGIVNMVEAAG